MIFRATAQWFISMSHNGLREKALAEIDRVRWVPEWGRDRIHGMISARPDWCISRQRVWGVPLIAFKCTACEENLLSAAVIRHVAGLFETEGADIWFTAPVEELLPPPTACAKCGGRDFEKGTDILDVWFDSGASHAAVLEKRPDLGWPCDVYLEGSDQHRGWFHSSLLESVATRGRSPYVSVITHGFVVDGEGKKMSKSLGNYISAQDMIKEKGAEMLRLGVAAEDYRNDLRLSKEILDRVMESYRRIRNTARFCLGNLSDFRPDEDAVKYERLAREMDRWALQRLSAVVEKVRQAYDQYEFHLVVSSFNEFCVLDMSSLYLDVAKDILYCDGAGSGRRRSAQTVLFEVVRALSQLLAPILPMTAEEIWDHVPAFSGKTSSVHLSEFPAPLSVRDPEMMERWAKLLEVRTVVLKELESLRAEKKIGQSLQAAVEIFAPEATFGLLRLYEKDLAQINVVSRVSIQNNGPKEEMRVIAEPISGVKCERCWAYPEDVRVRGEHPLCDRCADAVERA